MINTYTTQMTTHQLMHALIWLADCIKPLHSAGALVMDIQPTYIVSQMSSDYSWHRPQREGCMLPDRLLPNREAAAEVQIGLV